MFEITRKKHSIWLILVAPFANLGGARHLSTGHAAKLSVQSIRELSPYLQRDLGLRDIDNREHRMR